MNFGYDEIEALKHLTGADKEEEETHVYGSALNPKSLHSKPGEENKEIAKPNAAIEVKTFDRDSKGGASEDSLAKAREALKAAALP